MRFLIFICLFNSSIAFSQINGYQSDFTILTTSLEELSPVLYKKLPKEQYKILKEETFKKLAFCNTHTEANYHIQSFLFKIGDGHIGNISVYAPIDLKYALPFQVLIHNHKLYIKNFPTAPELNQSEIFSIENIPAHKLIDSLKIFTTNDGGRELEDFRLNLLFTSLFGSYITQQDTIFITTSNGKYNVPCISDKDSLYLTFVKPTYSQYLGSDFWIKTEKNPDYIYFKCIGFAKKLNHKSLLHEFENLIDYAKDSSVQNLIIDLRYNSGGDPFIASKIAAYLFDQPFQFVKNNYITPNKASYPSHIEKAFLLRFRKLIYKKENDTLLSVFNKATITKMIKPAKKHFNGTIYIITNSMTHSSSTMLCQSLSKLPNVVFIGSETCGAINYLCAYNHCKIQLPNLNCNYSFGLNLLELQPQSSFYEIEKPLVPTIQISYSIGDIFQGKDNEMEWILQRIKK